MIVDQRVCACLLSMLMKSKENLDQAVTNDLIDAVSNAHNIARTLLINDVNLLEQVLNMDAHKLNLHVNLRKISIGAEFRIIYKIAYSGGRLDMENMEDDWLALLNA